VNERSARRQASRRSPWPRRALIAAIALAIFALGIALGKALNDGPPSASTQTYVRTLQPLPQQPATTSS
jgi:hypothetical protein